MTLAAESDYGWVSKMTDSVYIHTVWNSKSPDPSGWKSGKKTVIKTVVKTGNKMGSQVYLEKERDILKKLGAGPGGYGIPTVLDYQFGGYQELGLSYPCLALSYAPGMDMYDYIWADGESHIPIDKIRSIFKRIVEIVEYAHSFGVYHRDIKAENVIYDPITEKVTLIDWEFAECVEKQPEEASGTCSYAAPEVLERKHFGPINDVWSLGVLLFAMTTKSFPIASDGTDGSIDWYSLRNFLIEWDNEHLLPEVKTVLKKIFVPYDKRITSTQLAKDSFFASLSTTLE